MYGDGFLEGIQFLMCLALAGLVAIVAWLVYGAWWFLGL